MKSINKFFMIALVMLILFSVSSVFAVQNETIMTDDASDALTIDDESVSEEEVLNTNDDEIISSSEDNDVLSDTGNYNDLQGKIDAGGNVSLDKDYQYADGGYDSVSIGKSVVVDGHGHYIDARSKTGIFNSHKTGNIDVVLKNIIFKNAKTENGGALHFTVKNSKFTIINCTFLNDGAREDGGAINCQYSYLIIDGCTFNTNYAYRCGGAIYFEGDDNSLSLSNCQFNSNQANRYGGAIYIDGKVDVFKHSSFNKNFAYNHGGAVYVKSNHENDFIVDSCPFVENEVKGDGLKGGAIYNCGPGTVTFRNSDFSDNMGSNEGGAIYSSETIKIDACNFTRNKAHDNGGAIFADVIDWADSTSIFTRNQVARDNMVSANKGGAIYAQKFGNTAKKLVFDQNWAYYGGAIYINSKGNANIESSLFVGNVASHADGTAGCGAAIYMDSAGAKLTLRYNIFVGNNAHDDKAVYNCGKYESVEYNWWGNNNPDFSQPYLVEWHRFTSNDKHSDSHPLSVVLSWGREPTSKFENGTLNVKFVTKEGMDLADKMDGYVASLTSDKKATIKATDKKYSFIFTPLEAGQYAVTIQMSNEWGTLLGGGGTIHTNITGDFAVLQNLVNNAQDVLNLERDFTYSPNVDTITEGIVIDKPLTINGNGHTIDALKNSRIFNITSNGVTINNVTLKNGKASEGGAIYIQGDNAQILNSYFSFNVADIGGAIRWVGSNGKVSNSIFLNNTASVKDMTVKNERETLVFTLTGNENYINAIYSDKDLSFSNVTYWNGTAKTNATPVKSDVNFIVNSLITLIIREHGMFTHLDDVYTKENGVGTYYYLPVLADGNYTFTATHYDDSYYSEKSVDGSLSVSHVAPKNSSVEIITPNGTEFNQTYVHIDFKYENKTEIRAVITDYNGTKIYDSLAGSNYIEPILPASDEYYNITIYNLGNETTNPSRDSILFKVNKILSHIQITESPGYFNYSATSGISFEGDSDCHNYNVTIYDENNKIAYSEIVWVANADGSMSIPVLDAGRYTITVTNLGNENKKENSASDNFTVSKINNNCTVSVDDNVYGRDITVTVRASADGEYIVKINSTTVTVNVVDGVGSETVELGAGYYTANVTSARANYNNNATNDTFTIEKAQSNVGIFDFGNVVYNQGRTIRFTDFYPARYNVVIYQENVIITSENTTSLLYTIPSNLPTGTYNLTVTNLGNDNVIGSQYSYTFNVESNNNVEIIVDDEDYGRDLLVLIYADVDGYYTVDINGTELTIEVENRIGFNNTLQLPAGTYYANVTFDNPFYTNNITNTTFTVFQVESDLEIYEIGNVTYGEDVVVRFYDDYPTVFFIEVTYKNGTSVMNTTFEYDDKSPEMSVIFSGLAVGEYRVNVTNYGSDSVIGNSSYMEFNVTKATPQIVVDTSDVTYPEDVVVIITTNVDGNYAVKVGNQTKNVTLIANEETYVIFEDMSAGEYVINVTYKETENYTSAFTAVNVTVNKNDEFDMDIETNESGDITTLVINFPKDATGNVTVKIKGKGNYTARIVNGTATVDIKNLTDDDEFDVIYSGDENYPAKNKNTTNALLYSEIHANDMTRGYNSGTDYQVTLLDKNGKPVANAAIEFTINGKKYSAVTNANGVASINPKLAIGTYTVTASNPFNKQTITKTLKIVTRITGNKNVNTYYGKNYQYKLRIIGDNGSPVGAGVAVKVTINGKAKTLKTDKNGYITMKFTKTYLPKTYTVKAEYKGITVSNKIKVKKVLTLKKAKVKKSAKKLVLKATLKEGKKALKGKKVVFKFKGKKYKAKTNKKGIAKVTIKKSILKKLKVGKKIKYQVTYLKHTVKRTVKVKK